MKKDSGRARSSHPEVFSKRGVLENFAKTPVTESLFNKVADLSQQFYLKKTLVQMFFCEFCEIFKGYVRHLNRYTTSPTYILYQLNEKK